jgi:hypothetical protein
MQQRESTLRHLLKAGLVFLVSYLAFLTVWIKAKDYYARGVTTVASYLVSTLKDVEVIGIKQKGDIIVVSFLPQRYKSRIGIDIDVKTSVYTFNTPLSLAIMAAMFSYLRRKHKRLMRVYIEGLCILGAVHLVYVFSMEGESITRVMMLKGYEKQSIISIFFWQFLWQFTDNMIIRFEPFLLGAYLYLRKPV